MHTTMDTMVPTFPLWEVTLTDPQTLVRHTIAIDTKAPRLDVLRDMYPGLEVLVRRHGNLPHGTFKLGDIFDFSTVFSVLGSTNPLTPAKLTVEDIAPNEVVINFKGTRSLVWPRVIRSTTMGKHRPNAVYQQQAALAYDDFILGVRSFDLPTQDEVDMTEEEDYFTLIEAKVEKDATNMVRSIVGKLLRQEKIILTPAQAKRLRKKENKAKGGEFKGRSVQRHWGQVLNAAPKPKVSKIKAKTYNMVYFAMLRDTKLTERKNRKMQRNTLMDMAKFMGWLHDMEVTVNMGCEYTYNERVFMEMASLCKFLNNMEVK